MGVEDEVDAAAIGGGPGGGRPTLASGEDVVVAGAPCCLNSSRLPTVPSIRPALAWRPRWAAAWPTPPAAPWTSAASPGRSRPNWLRRRAAPRSTPTWTTFPATPDRSPGRTLPLASSGIGQAALGKVGGLGLKYPRRHRHRHAGESLSVASDPDDIKTV